MFATLLGGLPRPDAGDDALRVAVEAQERLGLELISSGGLAIGSPVEAWRATASLTDRPVKQTVLGPYTRGRGTSRERARSTAIADALNAELLDLRDAGCPFIEIDEPDAILIGDDDTQRRRFVDAHRRLTRDVEGVHLSLLVHGGNADTAGPATFFDLPYASYAFDLIAGPDNWRLAARAPADRGIVCGALSPEPKADQTPEPLVWAVHYAASSRGLDRVGLANAPGLDRYGWDVALVKLDRVAHAARIAALPTREAVAQAMDPRAVSARSAALGRVEPEPRRRVRAPQPPPDSA
jgi:methionine synthase II (cobalamin-independent)